MKKLKLIILFIAVAGLAVGIYFLAKDDKPAEIKEDVQDAYLTVKIVKENIKEISLVNESGSFAFIKKDGEWMNVFEKEVKTSGNAIYAIESILKQTMAVDEIEKNISSSEKYGLNKPVATVKYVTEDGKTGFLKIGNSVVGVKNYFTVDDVNVYTMDISESGIFMAGMSAFLDMSLVKAEISEFESISIYNKGEEIIVSKKTATEAMANNADSLFTYTLRKPVVENASPDNTQKLFESIASLRAAEYNPYAEDDACGFDKSERYFSYETARTSGKFILGKKAGNGYTFIKAVGKDGAYKISDEAIAFMEYSAFELVDKHIALFYYDEINSITIEGNGEKYVLETGENPKINGKSIEKDDAQEFFRMFISLSYDGSTEAEVENSTTEVTVTIEHKNGKDVTRYNAYDAVSYAVLRNGAAEFTIQRKYVDKIVDLIKEL